MLKEFETKCVSPVSLSEYMNARATRKVLNAAFKRFQRLPDWPSVNLKGNKGGKEERREHQRQGDRASGLSADGGGLSQTFAE